MSRNASIRHILEGPFSVFHVVRFKGSDDVGKRVDSREEAERPQDECCD